MPPKRLLVVQTAFLGDVILTLPLVQLLKRELPSAEIDVMTIPGCAEVLGNHPAITGVIVFDKRGRDSGLGGLLRKAKELRVNGYDVAIVPHRSLRSALVARLAGIPERIGFDSSTGSMFFTATVHYEKSIHEIERNLFLVRGIREFSPALHKDFQKELPNLYPSTGDKERVDDVLRENGIGQSERMIGIAPGTVWNTKRWHKERFAQLASMVAKKGLRVALIGGAADESLCAEILAGISSPGAFSAAKKLSILQSAELIRRCAVLVSNDSAPVHLAVAMRTPVIDIYGATSHPSALRRMGNAIS